MDINDFGVLGDWYEDQGENGELVRNLLYILNYYHGYRKVDGFGYSNQSIHGIDWAYGKLLGVCTGNGFGWWSGKGDHNYARSWDRESYFRVLGYCEREEQS